MRRIVSADEAKKCLDWNKVIPRVDGSAAFEVAGAGTLVVGQHWSHTGNATGLSIGVTWGKHGLAAGVMDREELKNLRDYLNAYLANEHLVSYEGDTEDEPITVRTE